MTSNETGSTSHPQIHLTRRQLLGTLGFAAAVTVLQQTSGQNVALAAPTVSTTTEWSGDTSRNGWPIIDQPTAVSIEGSAAEVLLAPGAAATILEHVCRRWSYEIDTLVVDDVTGFSNQREIAADYESNYLSGTAVRIRQGAYPVGASENYFDNQLLVIRDILGECGGVVQWGGDETVPSEGHFELAFGPEDSRVQALADLIQSWLISPGSGAGTVDAADPDRQEQAAEVEEQQTN